MIRHLNALVLACLLIALVLMVMALVASPARPQELPCIPREALEAQLLQRYGETVAGAGMTPMGPLYLTVNPETGSFSIIQLKRDGMACLIAGGRGWASTEATKPGLGL